MLAGAIEQIRIVIDGWTSLVVRNDDVEMLLARRELVCKRCEHKRAMTCKLCGCPLSSKLRAVSASCPDSRW